MEHTLLDNILSKTSATNNTAEYLTNEPTDQVQRSSMIEKHQEMSRVSPTQECWWYPCPVLCCFVTCPNLFQSSNLVFKCCTVAKVMKQRHAQNHKRELHILLATIKITTSLVPYLSAHWNNLIDFTNNLKELRCQCTMLHEEGGPCLRDWSLLKIKLVDCICK